MDQTLAPRAGTQVQWLQKRIDESIERVSKRAAENQRRATYVKLLTLLFAGASTILLGLEVTSLQGTFKQIAFVLTAIITLAASIEPFFNFRGLWIEHERAEYKFHLLRDDLNFYVSRNGEDAVDYQVIAGFQSRFQAIWAELSESWLDQRQGQRYNI